MIWSWMFLGTFLIGLREGLEATLIVGIIAAFLRRNGRSLRPLIVGVLAAVGLSVAVGIGLQAFSQSLPQAQQEALETVIGAVAVVFVTTMLLWMNHHAKNMKHDLEHDAASALHGGGALALAGMAFLAVLKEGFETAVFLLAALQTSQSSAGAGVIGAVSGILLSVVIGIGVYWGGLRLNLRRFFQITGLFLVFIAAGLVLNVFRTAHEAGWITIGQQQVADFSGWMPKTSILSALVTGMFGIPTDPRLIEAVAWLAYLVPVLAIYLWPDAWVVPRARRHALKGWLALTCVALAATLFWAVPRSETDDTGHDALQVAATSSQTSTGTSGSDQTVSIQIAPDAQTAVLTLDDATPSEVTLQRVSEGSVGDVPVTQWETTQTVNVPAGLPDTPALSDLQRLNGGRLPTGLVRDRTPGPFTATWSQRRVITARTSEGSLISAAQDSTLTAVLSGGGLATAKTVNVSGGLDDDWAVSDAVAQSAMDQRSSALHAAAERALWWAWIPSALLIAALGLLTSAWRDRRQTRAADAVQQADSLSG